MHPVPLKRGVGRRHEEGRVAVDAEAATDETRLKRTAKTCGPDVAVLASMHPEATVFRGATEAKEPFSGESTL